jgi:hypothetical protein
LRTDDTGDVTTVPISVFAASVHALGEVYPTHDVQVRMVEIDPRVKDRNVHIDRTRDATGFSVHPIDPGWECLCVRMDFAVRVDKQDLGSIQQILQAVARELGAETSKRVTVDVIELRACGEGELGRVGDRTVEDHDIPPVERHARIELGGPRRAMARRARAYRGT